ARTSPSSRTSPPEIDVPPTSTPIVATLPVPARSLIATFPQQLACHAGFPHAARRVHRGRASSTGARPPRAQECDQIILLLLGQAQVAMGRRPAPRRSSGEDARSPCCAGGVGEEHH